jgi:hypothetical protein
MGDFSSLQDVPGMYRYCKSTEQSDFSLVEFVGGHLLNLDGMSDKRDHHDTQKSHTSPPRHHQHAKAIGLLAFLSPTGIKFPIHTTHTDHFTREIYLSDYVADIFHPPTA